MLMGTIIKHGDEANPAGPFSLSVAPSDNSLPVFGGYGVSPRYSGSGVSGLFAWPVYFVILGLAIGAYFGVSAPATFLKAGLHLHPIYGVAAFLVTIWLYRQLMTFLPTAILIAIPASLFSGALAWAVSNPATFRPLTKSIGQKFFSAPLELWAIVQQQLIPAINGWTALTFLVCLMVHLAYWQHRRIVAQRTGWVFTTSPLNTLRDFAMMAVLSVAIGWLISLEW